MIAVLLLLFAPAQPSARAPAPDAASAAALDGLLKKFTDVLAIAQTEAADPVNIDPAIYQGAIPGMLRELDPHSVFFDPGQYEQLKQMEKSESKGFGSILSILPGRVIVLQALPGTPSAKAGLSPGDEILAVNRVPLNRLDFDELIGFLGESRQRQARLDVRRPGNARLLQFVLNPELVDSPSVDRAFFLRPLVGYIHVSSFDAQTGRHLKQAIEKLGGEKLKGLVIDLRNNPGGVVQSALEAAALFLKPEQRILSVKGRAVQGDEVNAPKNATPYAFPLSILVNGKSASAAEIVAGALQDHDRASIAGEPTYGKGLVQNVFPLSSNTGMALTTAFYYTPSGRSIQRPLKSGQLEVEISRRQYRTDSGRVVTGGGGIQPDLPAAPEEPSRLRVALDAGGVLVSFATDYTQRRKIDDSFEPTPALLDEFQVFASERQIQPPVGEWSREREWVRSRLKQEIFNLALGVEKGDEVEAQRDPQVRAALRGLKIGIE